MPQKFDSSWPIYHFKHFEITEFKTSTTIVELGGQFTVTGKIKNNGQELATTYLIIKLANPYDHNDLVVDTDRDFSDNQKQSLRFVDIKPNGKTEFSVTITVDIAIKSKVLDISLELWSPGRLFWSSAPLYAIALFERLPWRGSIEILNQETLEATVFISYAHDASKNHKQWVNLLAIQLNKRNIKTIFDQTNLKIGQGTTEFMETGINDASICLIICSEKYAEIADNRKSIFRGLSYEIRLITNSILEGTIAPLVILKDNPTKRIPKFTSSDLCVNMETKNWQGAPLNNLVQRIKEIASNL